jgi:hypothetical protein
MKGNRLSIDLNNPKMNEAIDLLLQGCKSAFMVFLHRRQNSEAFGRNSAVQEMCG